MEDQGTQISVTIPDNRHKTKVIRNQESEDGVTLNDGNRLV